MPIDDCMDAGGRAMPGAIAEAFDAASGPLQAGINLIEASAGTGKTYAIAMLVLRFVVEQELDIKRLLVVTFTKAATEELKDRIRKRLVEARHALNHDYADIDPNLRLWLDGLGLDAETIRQRLDLALLDIDQAPIFTIHGFCQRVLAEHALESGQMFDCELSGDIAAIRQNCADDFWRKQLYSRPAWQAALLTAAFPTPDSLLASLGNIGLQQTVYPVAGDPDAALAELHTLIAAAAERLPSTLKTLQAAFEEGLFNDSFTKTFADRGAALTAWLEDQNAEPADLFWLTALGLLAGLNGRKFMVSKTKPLPSDQQKQQYLATLNIDCSPFENLAAALQQLQVVFRRALLQELHDQLDKALQQNNVLSFDDLITRLAGAVQGDNGQLLINELQQRFGAALIDEFQDTDYQQWRIFSRIFSAIVEVQDVPNAANAGAVCRPCVAPCALEGIPPASLQSPFPEQFLYLIGDPKQAIYKFRGADIYSYFAARSQARYHYTLSHNWRSHPDLVRGVNRLFQRGEPFLFDNLDFISVQAGRGIDDGRIGAVPPLVLWQLDQYSDKQVYWTSRRGTNGEAAEYIRNAVVAEILQLLDQAAIITRHGSQPVKPKDIAILVRSNNQAAAYQQALNEAGIPAVLNSKQSVFVSPQALEIHTVLQAVAQPGHIPALKQALTVAWFNLDGQQLYRLFSDDCKDAGGRATQGAVAGETGLDAWLSRFQDYHQIWQQHGLLTMMQRLLQQEGVEEHLGARPQAERALTNLHHIIERLQQAGIDEHLAINKTLDWLRHAIQQAPQNSSDDQQLRLESDEDAVKIVTLHSSKGLEYPVVFCPSLWQRSDRLKNEQYLIQCHENGEMIADLGSEQFIERREQAIYEELAEDLRLFYVAATRAQYRCYIAWADVRTKDKANDSALAYLLDLGAADFAAQQQSLRALAVELPQSFEYRLLATDTAVEGYYRSAIGDEPLICRQRQRSLQTYWQMSSYTALSALSLHDAPELPEDKAVEASEIEIMTDDIDAVGTPAKPNSDLPTTAWMQEVYPQGHKGQRMDDKPLLRLLDSVPPVPQQLPKGAQTGNVVHSLLEIISFKRLAAGADISQARDQAIRRYGLNIENPTLIDRLLQTVVNAPLGETGDFSLKNLPAERCLKEMPFYLAMQDMDAARINHVLSDSPAYQPLSSKQMCGYLTGFIDLICEYRGKYYVMDYKTNSLPDYRPETLLQAMREHNYGLQYWLYSLVLDRYLRQRLPGYEYGRHFGGVKYLFVRGMEVELPGAGVFEDLPDLGMLEALGVVFFG
jgi:exodeoxyribonuclease V beta subunit